MSNSPLVSYIRLSPHRTHPRNHVIDRVSVHCLVGQWTAKQGCDYFATTDRDCSANYIVGKDGSIGLSVEEADRSWCTSNAENDNRAITIEVASDTTHPYAVTDAALEALKNLLVDICQRNGKTRLIWFGDKEKSLAYTPAKDEMVMTVHRWFAAKACPGQYLYDLHGEIAKEVTERLNQAEGEPELPPCCHNVYRTLNDVPECYRPTIQKLMERKALGGYEDPDPSRLDDNILNLGETYCRVMTSLDRLGVLG